MSAPPQNPPQSLPAWKLALVAIVVIVAAVLGFALATGVHGMVEGKSWFANGGNAPSSPTKKSAAGGNQPGQNQPAGCYECEQKNLATP